MQVVLHVRGQILGGRDVDDFGEGRGDAIEIVESETDLDTGFVAAGLLRGAAGKEADGIGAPLGKDGLKGVGEAVSVSKKKDDGGNAPGHADHGDGGAAAVVEHRFPGLGENVFQHRWKLPSSDLRMPPGSSGCVCVPAPYSFAVCKDRAPSLRDFGINSWNCFPHAEARG